MKKNHSESELNFLGHTTSITGNIKIEGDLRLNGKVKGNVECTGSIFVGENGEIEGDLSAQEAIIGGKIIGNVKINNKITLEAKSNLLGNLMCARLVIDEGANFEGNSAMIKTI